MDYNPILEHGLAIYVLDRIFFRDSCYFSLNPKTIMVFPNYIVWPQ